MRLARYVASGGPAGVAVIEGETCRPLDLRAAGLQALADILHDANPPALARVLAADDGPALPLDAVRLLAPVDRQEIWAAGVTYKRSQQARMEESETGASHYDRVYTAARPELFFKAAAQRACGPGDAVRVRSDSHWSVPEPEFTLVISPALKLVGYTVGNDMSARDIEGENPLYLPQAKVYDGSCSVGPCVLLADGPLDRTATRIVLSIDRGGREVFRGETNLDQMARSFEDLIDWLGRECSFPQGALLLTGTGIVPPDEFTLEDGDVVAIEITGIGRLVNPVVKRTGESAGTG
ncbi:MAG: fumarylacetoacetate hydrolase family protein [Planctomycetes bacterium]|nr:fumarylacetoacetate hydrolase family protein [Planctomycetota bacterium]